MYRGLIVGSVILFAGACDSFVQTTGPINTAPTSQSHAPFSIASGPHAVDCNVCHGAYSSFKGFTCMNCHGHQDAALIGRLHLGVPTYAYESSACYTCHGTGARQPFAHTGITDNCAACHDVGTDFAALPLAGFTHQTITADCSACHLTTTWLNATGAPPGLKSDPTKTLTVDALIPSYGPYSITALTPKSETLPMSMAHLSTEIPSAANSSCTNCHATVAPSSYYPGIFHGSLARLGLSQPAGCVDCHLSAMPTGFVGPLATSPPRSPPSSEMKHDAVVWSGGQPGTAPVVTAECGVCHAVPSSQLAVRWNTDPSGLLPPTFHAALSAAGLAQPDACVDCHANSQPPAQGPNGDRLTNATMLTTASNDPTTGVPPGTFDQINHRDLNVISHDCGFCHAQAGFSQVPGIQGKEWAQARFHQSFAGGLVLDGAAGRCSNCHMNVVPGASFTAQDHTSLNDVAGSQDCNACHAWPGTGTPSTPNWLGASGSVPQCLNTGGFTIPNPPAPNTTTVQSGLPSTPPNCPPHPDVVAPTSCATCHSGGKGGKNALGYDHASSVISANCNACHEAGSNLVGTVWNGSNSVPGAGDTRPYTLNGVNATFSGNSRFVTYPNHFYEIDCIQCHLAPAGISTVTTGGAYTSAWRFPHDCNRMAHATCLTCHPGGTEGCD